MKEIAVKAAESQEKSAKKIAEADAKAVKATK